MNERPSDPQDEANRPIEPKARGDVESGRSEPPHSELRNPIGEPDETSAGDPYERDPEAGDPPPPGEYPGPGPEPSAS